MSPAAVEPSVFNVTVAPPDALFGVLAAYKADPSPIKVDVSVGAYRDDSGKPWVLPVVKKVDVLLKDDPTLDHEYLPITGLPDFTAASAKLVLGADADAIKTDRVASVQTISGTGANHLGALFLARHPPTTSNGTPSVYISSPTWPNHKQIFANVGIPVKEYPYWDAATLGLDLTGFLATLEAADPGSIILLHACAHNPTGVDPTPDQWKTIAEVMIRRNLFAFFDCAYQGFASGDLDKDAWAVRYFLSLGVELLVCQSFAKNFGLYGERAGALHVVSSSADVSVAVKSQLALLQRSEISNPPAYGARIVAKVLNDPTLFNEWTVDLKIMAGRIQEMRKVLFDKLIELGTPGTWNHIIDQIGMFSFTGLTPAQVAKITKEYHVYLTANGRISMAGLNSHNVEYFAKAVDSVVRTA
ncbi:pyridoxal phosphate-dependent transferase [Limtongia smithiae]|uniref:pyridoxal phosphate-dependent transferase n=1 Tax=Limtongia smithiae TaxID=1125753 RepID=UPI0034CE4C56